MSLPSSKPNPVKARKGRPTLAVVDRDALRSNLAEVRKCVAAGVSLMAIVKADAYGHGAPEVARVLEKEGVKAFGVATVEEGVALRDGGVIHPDVYVLAGFVADQVEDVFRHRLTPVICDLEMARVLDQRLRGSMRALPVHVKADTGLGRLGLTNAELPAFLTEMKRYRGLQIVGLCSHLASAVRVEGSSIDRQVEAFARAAELLAIHGSPPKVRHLANSAATLSRPDLHFDMVRPGIALYGSFPGGRESGPVDLRPAMTLKTSILQLRGVPAGTGVSYDHLFTAKRETLLAVLPVGYADGYPRRLSNRAEVLVRGRRAPVVGAVCMDVTVVDVTDVPGVERGDEVVLWGRQDDAEIRVDEVAAWAETIAYELLTTVGRRVPRVYVN